MGVDLAGLRDWLEERQDAQHPGNAALCPPRYEVDETRDLRP